jgi:3-dehydroquinate dehydratase-2
LPKVFVLNGVNLASLGERRPEVYGEQTLQDIEQLLRNAFPDVELEFRQTDYEGELVDWIHGAANSDGLVLNPGAWTHYFYAIHDALEIIAIPKVVVHLSNVHAREEGWRRTSVISPVVDSVVAGIGGFGYLAAVRYILRLWNDGGGTGFC